MCEHITDTGYTIHKPTLAWKVICRRPAYHMDGDGPYYLPFSALNFNPSRWLSGKIMSAFPKAVTGRTMGGLHVFWTEPSAFSYATQHCWLGSLRMIPLLVWGKAIGFKGGAAVEFATLAERNP